MVYGLWIWWTVRNDSVHGKKHTWFVAEMVWKLKSIVYQSDKYIGRKLCCFLPSSIFKEADYQGTCVFCDVAWQLGVKGVCLVAVMINEGFVQAICYTWVDEVWSGY